MPSTESAKTGIRYGYSDGETGWGVETNETLRRIDVELIPQWAQKRATTTGLTFGYYGGIVPSASSITQIADGTILLTASQTNYVEHDAAGTVTANISGFTAGRWPMAEVVTNAGAIISVTDRRLLVGTPAGAGSGWALSGNPAKVRNALGAFDIQFRNNADSATNLGITDAGAVSVRTSLVVGTDPGGAEILRVGGQALFRLVGGGAITLEGYTNQANYKLRRANGAVGAPTMILSGQNIGEISFQGYNGGSASFEYGAEILAITEEDFDTTGQVGTALQIYTAAVGSVMTGKWTFRGAGHLSPLTDNVYDLGEAALRLRTGRFGTSLVLGLASPVTVDLNGANNLRINNSLDLSGTTPWIGASANTSFTVRTNNVDRWFWDASGHLVAATDAVYDLGSATNRPRDGRFSRFLAAGTPITNTEGIEATITATGAPASFGVRDGSINPRLRVFITAGNPSQINLQTESALNSAKLYLVAHGGGSEIAFSTNAATQWFINDAGHFLTGAETQNIGAQASGRPLNVFVKGAIDLFGAVSIKLNDIDFVAFDATYHILKEKTGIDAIKLAAGTNVYQNDLHIWRTAAGADRAKLDLSSGSASVLSVGESSFAGDVQAVLETNNGGGSRNATYLAKSTNPRYRTFVLGQAADEGQWEVSGSGANFLIRPVTDAGAAGGAAITIIRGTGTALSRISFSTHLTPSVNVTHDLGQLSGPLRWRTAYVQGVDIGAAGALTLGKTSISVAVGTTASALVTPFTYLTITGTNGTVTITPPASPTERVLLLVISNTASGTANLTWDAAFQTGSLPSSLASGAISSLLVFIYATDISKWIKAA